jgi:hypothetical protein
MAGKFMVRRFKVGRFKVGRFKVGRFIASPFRQSTDIAVRARQESRFGSRAKGDRQHPECGIKPEGKVRRADVAQPEVFAPPELPPVAIESGVGAGRKSFRQKQLALAQGSKGDRANRIGAFMEHRLVPFFSSVEFWPERFHQQCTRKAVAAARRLETINL